MWCGYLDKEHECYEIATTRCFPAHGASEEEKRKVVEKLSQFGVEHGDVRDDNFVRSPEGQLFIIDFGLSELSGLFCFVLFYFLVFIFFLTLLNRSQHDDQTPIIFHFIYTYLLL